MNRLSLIALLLCGCASSVAQDTPKPKRPHNGYLSQCFCDWRCDCPKCLHVRECIVEIRQEMIDAREGREPNLSKRDKEFIATVHKLEFLLRGVPDDPPLSPVHGPGERDPYARFKSYAVNTDGRGSYSCANCNTKMTKQQRDSWNFCPECGTHIGGIEVLLFPGGAEVRDRGK